jgi:hypothetical protein
VTRTRSQAGRHAKLVGDLHEGWNEQQLTKAVHLGIVAHYYHNQPTAKKIRGVWELTAPGVSDYTGVLESQLFANFPRWGAGTSLAVEAKTVDGTRFYRSDVTREQQDHLEAVARAGGLALLSIAFRVADGSGFVRIHRFVIPWLEVKWQKLRSAESINFESGQDWLQQWTPRAECYLLRWHPGGKRSGSWLPAGQGRVYPVE